MKSILPQFNFTIKLILICVVISSPKWSMADAWDNLTMQEAELVVEELKRNPYIFKYCDCCGDESNNIYNAELVHVTNTEIIPCDWAKEFVSVRYEYESIAEVSYIKGILKAIPPAIDEGAEGLHELIYMNYTRCLNKSSKKATAIFNVITYEYYGEDPEMCKSEYPYPSPKELASFYKNKAYTKWWKKQVK